MSVANNNSSVSVKVLNGIVANACVGFKNAEKTDQAHKALDGLYEKGVIGFEQQDAIKNIIVNFYANNAIGGPLYLKKRIVEVLNLKIIEVPSQSPKQMCTPLAIKPQIIPQNTFTNALHEKCVINHEQFETIQKTITNCNTNDSKEGPQVLKNGVIAVLNSKTLEAASQSEVRYIEWPVEIIEKIFDEVFQMASEKEYRSLLRLGCVNKHFNQILMNFVNGFNLEKLFPGLTIIDAKMQGIEVDDEPLVNPAFVRQCFKEHGLAWWVEGSKGCTLLTMSKGLTFMNLLEVAEKAGINVEINCREQLAKLETLGVHRIERTYRVMISNNVIGESRGDSYYGHTKFLSGIKCEMPTLEEYFALLVYTRKFFVDELPNTQWGSPEQFGKYLFRARTLLHGAKCIQHKDDPSTWNIQNVSFTVWQTFYRRSNRWTIHVLDDDSCSLASSHMLGCGGRRRM